jgi:DNA-binding GntR family transcriptional regulator
MTTKQLLEELPGRAVRPAVKHARHATPVTVPARATRPPLPSVDAIHQRVLLAIVEHRLPPGTKLGEERLAKVFGVSRTQIRQVLERLAHDSIVTVHAHRGAFVSSPTVEEAREVFAARRLIEPDLIRQATQAAKASDIRRLRDHVASESAARAANDKRAIIRLSGEFHQVIADIAGNRFLARTMRELETLTCLVIVLYDAPNVPACPYHEHSDLVDAIEARDAERAAALMVDHLQHVEAALDFQRSGDGEIDFDAVFS